VSIERNVILNKWFEISAVVGHVLNDVTSVGEVTTTVSVYLVPECTEQAVTGTITDIYTDIYTKH